MNQDQQNEAEWRDSGNWKPVIGTWLTIYASGKDSRIIVPKRNGEAGFTVNAGKPAGKAILLFLTIILPLVIMSVIIGIMRAG